MTRLCVCERERVCVCVSCLYLLLEFFLGCCLSETSLKPHCTCAYLHEEESCCLFVFHSLVKQFVYVVGAKTGFGYS